MSTYHYSLAFSPHTSLGDASACTPPQVWVASAGEPGGGLCVDPAAYGEMARRSVPERFKLDPATGTLLAQWHNQIKAKRYVTYALVAAGMLVAGALTVALVMRKKRKQPNRRRRNGDPATMTAGQINKALDRLDAARSKLVDALIAAGRGHERHSETLAKGDSLSRRYIANSDEMSALRDEISRRCGPGAPHRLPRGFGPIRRY